MIKTRFTPLANGSRSQIDLDYYIHNELARKTIVLSTGLTGVVEDYAPFIEALEGEYRIISYNFRGHGGSDGVFTMDDATDDLAQIVEREHAEYLIGHSVGAALSARVARKNQDIKAVVMLNPYLGKDLGGTALNYLVNSCSALPPAAKMLDVIIDRFPYLRNKAGIKNRKALESFAELSFTDSDTVNVPTLYFLAGRDSVIGTNNPEKRQMIKNHIAEVFPLPFDCSRYSEELNHCMNRKGIIPFFKNGNKPVVDAIMGFLRYADTA